MINKIILIAVAVSMMVLSGLFAGAETGIYQLSRLRLRLGIEKRRLSSTILGKTMRDSFGLLLSLLVGINLAHYIITSIVTFLLLSKLDAEHTAELLATCITAPVLFVFAELIPKNIFFYHTDYLMLTFAPVLFVSHKLFSYSGIVPLLRFIYTAFTRLTGAPDPSGTKVATTRRPHVEAIFHETQEEGFLTAVQTNIINRLVSMSNLSINSVMTPLNKARTVNLNSDRPALLNKLKKSPFTRLPVYDRWPANIIGFINIYEILCSAKQFTDLHDFIKPIRKLSADITVSETINIMQRENKKIILVTRATPLGREKHLGIVTMKDLVEELLGELTEW